MNTRDTDIFEEIARQTGDIYPWDESTSLDINDPLPIATKNTNPLDELTHQFGEPFTSIEPTLIDIESTAPITASSGDIFEEIARQTGQAIASVKTTSLQIDNPVPIKTRDTDIFEELAQQSGETYPGDQPTLVETDSTATIAAYDHEPDTGDELTSLEGDDPVAIQRDTDIFEELAQHNQETSLYTKSTPIEPASPSLFVTGEDEGEGEVDTEVEPPLIQENGPLE